MEKDIKGFESLYYVTDSGEILNAYKQEVKQYARNGYRDVILQKDGRHYRFSVHRLVADAFCCKPEGCEIVNHINGCKHDNRASNLEWTTSKGNSVHASQTGIFAAANRERLTTDGRLYANLIDRVYQRFTSITAFAAAMGITKSTMSYKLTGKTEWSRTDIIRACEVLDIPLTKVYYYFFSPSSCDNATAETESTIL